MAGVIVCGAQGGPALGYAIEATNVPIHQRKGGSDGIEADNKRRVRVNHLRKCGAKFLDRTRHAIPEMNYKKKHDAIDVCVSRHGTDVNGDMGRFSQDWFTWRYNQASVMPVAAVSFGAFDNVFPAARAARPEAKSFTGPNIDGGTSSRIQNVEPISDLEKFRHLFVRGMLRLMHDQLEIRYGKPWTSLLPRDLVGFPGLSPRFNVEQQRRTKADNAEGAQDHLPPTPPRGPLSGIRSAPLSAQIGSVMALWIAAWLLLFRSFQCVLDRKRREAVLCLLGGFAIFWISAWAISPYSCTLGAGPYCEKS